MVAGVRRRRARAPPPGDYFDNAESLEKRRRKDVRMNTEVRRVKETSKKSPR